MCIQEDIFTKQRSCQQIAKIIHNSSLLNNFSIQPIDSQVSVSLKEAEAIQMKLLQTLIKRESRNEEKARIKIINWVMNEFMFNICLFSIELNYNNMSNYDKILSQFKKLGYNQDSYLKEPEMLRALDAVASQNAGFHQFDRSIAQELWGHCNADYTRGVKLNDFINTILEAENILRQQVGITENAINQTLRPNQRAQLQNDYDQIKNDHHIITSPFRLPPLGQATLNNQQYEAAPLFQSSGHRSPIYRDQTAGVQSQDDATASDLKICMFIAVFMFVCELVLMFHKHHFLNILCIFGILSIFFLNYFDKDYIKFLLILLIASFVFDIVWLGVNAREYWSPDIQTQHSTLHSGFLAFIFIMVIIMMVLKIIVFSILVKYRDNPESTRKNVSAFGYKIKLDGRPTYNPFTPLLKSIN